MTDLIGGYSRQGQTINGLFTDVFSPTGRLSQVVQTVEGFRQTVQDLEAGTGSTFEQLAEGVRVRVENGEVITSLTQTVNTIEQLVQDEENIARMVMTSDLWHTEVAKVIDDSLEQEYETIVGYTPFYSEDYDRNLIYGDDRSITLYLPLDTANVVDGQLVEFSVDYQALGGSSGDVTAYIKYNDLQTSEVTLYRIMNNAKFYLYIPEGFGRTFDFHYKVNSSDTTWGKITKVTASTRYLSEVPVDSGNNGSISTKITQLYDMISLGVFDSGEALARVAMGEGGVHIKGEIVHIEAGKTLIDNAVIKDAHINNVSANKLTAGTIDAQEINVININADSITVNRGRMVQLALNDINSDMWLDGSSLTIDSHNGWDAKLNRSGLAAFSKEGVRLGSFGAVKLDVGDEEEKKDLEDAGVRMMANRGYRASISYQGTQEREIDSFPAVTVDGSTGHVALITDVFGSQVSLTGFRIGSQTIGGVRVTALYAVDRSGNEIGAIAFGGSNFYYAHTYNQNGTRTWKNMNTAIS